MHKIIKYTFFDLFRSKWFLIIALFFLSNSWGLLYFSTSLSKAILSILHVNIFVIPILSALLASIYFYNSRNFIELLISLPIKRSAIFLGQYLGISLSISLAILLGLGIPFLIYGIFSDSEIWNFLNLIMNAILLTFIFSAISYNISLLMNDKIKGFGMVILMLLMFTIIYDAVILILLLIFKDYPLEKLSIILTILNPIDLSRINTLLKLDVSALMGYTGAVFNKYFNTFLGTFISYTSLFLWIFLNIIFLLSLVRKKDF